MRARAAALLLLAACAAPGSTARTGPDACPGTLQLEVTNDGGTTVETYWTDGGLRLYLGPAVPGTTTFAAGSATGSPRFEQGGRLVTGRVAGMLSYRLFCR